jgi:hypothetical protein
MEKLHAIVKTVTGGTRHFLGTIGPTGIEKTNEFSHAAYVEIEADEGSFLLLRYDANGEFAGDTWHQSIEEAKDQACFEFEIIDSDWTIKS